MTIGSVGEQLLYEIGDPAAYELPDVICDFTEVSLEQVGIDRITVKGARGRGVPERYKASITWADGWRVGMVGFYLGARAAEKARIFADEAIQRARRKLSEMNAPDYVDVSVEVIGDQTKRFASPIISVDGRLCSSIIRAPRLMQPAHSM